MTHLEMEQRVAALASFLSGLARTWLTVLRMEGKIKSLEKFEELFKERFMNDPDKAKAALFKIRQESKETLMELSERVKVTAVKYGIKIFEERSDPRAVAFLRAIRNSPLRTQLFKEYVDHNFAELIEIARKYEKAMKNITKAKREGKEPEEADWQGLVSTNDNERTESSRDYEKGNGKRRARGRDSSWRNNEYYGTGYQIHRGGRSPDHNNDRSDGAKPRSRSRDRGDSRRDKDNDSYRQNGRDGKRFENFKRGNKPQYSKEGTTWRDKKNWNNCDAMHRKIRQYLLSFYISLLYLFI
eukprot:GHVU01083274.1.p1 GENE.GHVU01083274.1~~GHVU01083274.1.p1  ORF type:complete len:299 (-),score=39.16 GHVU01083274.1:67-963(-)